MSTLEAAERRADELARKLDNEIAKNEKLKAYAAKSLEIADRLEQRTDTAIRQLRDIIRQNEAAD